MKKKIDELDQLVANVGKLRGDFDHIGDLKGMIDVGIKVKGLEEVLMEA